jgi:CRP/FNR family transcriptional regulator, anaerobic regulatory protein
MMLLSHVSGIISVSEELKQAITSVSKKSVVAKNQTILSSGEKCNDIFFVEKGLLRGYYIDEEGKDITNWFAQENEFATCFYSFIAKQPSFEIIQTLENCELTKLTYADLQSLYLNFPETERIGRIITEDYYIKLEERILNLQFKTAKERYNSLLLLKPKLLQRASLGQIATYLGITQETLSRIRS